MSREPSSGQQRWSQAHGGWSSPQQEPPPEPVQPKRTFKVVVEPAKPKLQPPTPTRGYYTSKQREQAVAKQLMTTEALTDEERKIVRGYRISRRDLGMED